MFRKIILALLMALVVGCATTVPNESPTPISVPRILNKSDVELAVLLAVADRPPPPTLTPGQQITDNVLGAVVGRAYDRVSSPRQEWYYEDRDVGVVFAGYQRGKFYMRVAVRYDAVNVKMEIMESRNLSQSDGSIHKNAFVWLQTLENRVRRTLGQIARRNTGGKE